MQVAAVWLRDSATKIYAVANDMGCESVTVFSRAFKRVVGMSPRDWRELS
jgi:AraC-like DNA-binding protein